MSQISIKQYSCKQQSSGFKRFKPFKAHLQLATRLHTLNGSYSSTHREMTGLVMVNTDYACLHAYAQFSLKSSLDIFTVYTVVRSQRINKLGIIFNNQCTWKIPALLFRKLCYHRFHVGLLMSEYGLALAVPLAVCFATYTV